MKIFFGEGLCIDNVEPGSKVLAIARQNAIELEFGCGAGICGTCVVRVVKGRLSDMKQSEKQRLADCGHPDDGSVRLTCQARTVDEDLYLDLSYQNR